MATTIPKPEERVCGNCAEDRKENGLPPQQLVELARRTEKKHLIIRVCPSCDGNIAEIATMNN